jgi:hypothetical protein
MSTSIVTVTHNSSDVIGDMLRSLPAEVEVVLVDNASSDDVAATARAVRPDTVVIELTTNIGFGGGCNVGARRATGDVVIFLNPDCRPQPGAIEALSARASEDPTSIFGPALLDADGTLRSNLRRASRPYHEILEGLPSAARWVPIRWRRDLPADDPRYRDGGQVDYLQGACLAIARERFLLVGGFDEDFFLYSEEETLCLAVRARGGSCVYVPEVAVSHTEGTSTTAVRAFALRHLFRSRAIFFRKRYGELRGLLAIIAIASVMAVSWMLHPVAVALRMHASQRPQVERYALAGLFEGAIHRFGRLGP